jgi:hypothetical protein
LVIPRHAVAHHLQPDVQTVTEDFTGETALVFILPGDGYDDVPVERDGCEVLFGGVGVRLARVGRGDVPEADVDRIGTHDEHESVAARDRLNPAFDD